MIILQMALHTSHLFSYRSLLKLEQIRNGWNQGYIVVMPPLVSGYATIVSYPSRTWCTSSRRTQSIARNPNGAQSNSTSSSTITITSILLVVYALNEAGVSYISPSLMEWRVVCSLWAIVGDYVTRHHNSQMPIHLSTQGWTFGFSELSLVITQTLPLKLQYPMIDPSAVTSYNYYITGDSATNNSN